MHRSLTKVVNFTIIIGYKTMFTSMKLITFSAQRVAIVALFCSPQQKERNKYQIITEKESI